MSIKKKLRYYSDFKNISYRKFSMTIGKSDKFIATDGEIQSDVFAPIRKHFPDLNINWLLYNEGNMLLGENQTVAEPELKYGKGVKEMLREEMMRNIELEKENKVLQETVERLKKDNKQISN
jgi:hypothetical protein